VAIEIYLALIAALLLQLYTGQAPNRRMLELIQFYLLGVASLEELEQGLAAERQRVERRKKNLSESGRQRGPRDRPGRSFA
jgi:hypothetical protein